MTAPAFGATIPCHRCKGSGRHAAKACLACNGSGYVSLPVKAEFDGATLGELPDARQRLAAQLVAVREVMADGEWHTLFDLAQAANCSTQSASARLRDLRKPKFGGRKVERSYASGGTFLYRLVGK